MTTDAGSGFDDQAASRDAATKLDELEEESRHLAGDQAREAIGDPAVEDPEEARERKQVEDQVNDAF
jgi:hypothetical protein